MMLVQAQHAQQLVVLCIGQHCMMVVQAQHAQQRAVHC
jgi:hypothetical protein